MNINYKIDPKYLVWGDDVLYCNSEGKPISIEMAMDTEHCYFTQEQYFVSLLPALLVNALLFIYLVVNIIKIIKAIIFHIKVFIIRQRVAEQKRKCLSCGKVTDAMDGYIKEAEVISQLCKRGKVVTDEICSYVPAAVKRFYKRVDNTPILLKVDEQIGKLRSKKTAFLKFFYDINNEAAVKQTKRAWIGRAVRVIILCGIIFIINYPVEAVITPILEFIWSL